MASCGYMTCDPRLEYCDKVLKVCRDCHLLCNGFDIDQAICSKACPDFFSTTPSPTAPFTTAAPHVDQSTAKLLIAVGVVVSILCLIILLIAVLVFYFKLRKRLSQNRLPDVQDEALAERETVPETVDNGETARKRQLSSRSCQTTPLIERVRASFSEESETIVKVRETQPTSSHQMVELEELRSSLMHSDHGSQPASNQPPTGDSYDRTMSGNIVACPEDESQGAAGGFVLQMEAEPSLIEPRLIEPPPPQAESEGYQGVDGHAFAFPGQIQPGIIIADSGQGTSDFNVFYPSFPSTRSYNSHHLPSVHSQPSMDIHSVGAPVPSNSPARGGSAAEDRPAEDRTAAGSSAVQEVCRPRSPASNRSSPPEDEITQLKAVYSDLGGSGLDHVDRGDQHRLCIVPDEPQTNDMDCQSTHSFSLDGTELGAVGMDSKKDVLGTNISPGTKAYVKANKMGQSSERVASAKDDRSSDDDSGGDSMSMSTTALLTAFQGKEWLVELAPGPVWELGYDADLISEEGVREYIKTQDSVRDIPLVLYQRKPREVMRCKGDLVSGDKVFADGEDEDKVFADGEDDNFVSLGFPFTVEGLLDKVYMTAVSHCGTSDPFIKVGDPCYIKNADQENNMVEIGECVYTHQCDGKKNGLPVIFLDTALIEIKPEFHKNVSSLHKLKVYAKSVLHTQTCPANIQVVKERNTYLGKMKTFFLTTLKRIGQGAVLEVTGIIGHDYLNGVCGSLVTSVANESNSEPLTVYGCIFLRDGSSLYAQPMREMMNKIKDDYFSGKEYQFYNGAETFSDSTTDSVASVVSLRGSSTPTSTIDTSIKCPTISSHPSKEGDNEEVTFHEDSGYTVESSKNLSSERHLKL